MKFRSLILSLVLSYSVVASATHLVFSDAPKDFKPTMDVAACFLTIDNQFLFLHRLDTSSEGNKWGIPGGKIDMKSGETPLEGVIREVKEETGFTMTPSKTKYLGKVYIRQLKPAKDFIYHMYEYKLDRKIDVKLSSSEHKGFTWMTLEDSMNYTLIQGEDECIERAYGISKTKLLK